MKFTRQTHQVQQEGQTIIEVLLAASIVTLVMTAIVAAITVSIRNTTEAKSRAVATKYAQEGVEFLRKQRAALGWESFAQALRDDGGASGFVTYCLASLANRSTQDFVNFSGGTCSATQFVDARGLFQRQAALQVNGTQTQVSVTVSVTWYDGEKQRSAQIAEEFHPDVN